MKITRKEWALMSPVLLAASLAGCSADPGTEQVTATGQQALIGGALPGTDAADFAEAVDNFKAIEGPEDGLGPVFNERGCGACHTDGANGGAGVQIERRFGRFVNGAFDPLEGNGGSLRQLFTLGTFNNGPRVCTVPLEVEPAAATVHNVGRLVTPLFGLGLVDAMPDSFFDGLAAAEPAAIRGIARRVPVQFPNVNRETNVPAQAVGSTRVARFGWKAAVPTLLQFAADAYINEMGITTQSCILGRSLNDFATESAPNGRPQAPGCDDLAPLQTAEDVAATGMQIDTDDAVGPCEPGQTEVQDDIDNFAFFMTHSAPPGPESADRADTISINRGSPLFDRIGCAGCHTRRAFVTPAVPNNGVPGNFSFHPFSDFLVHDMGTLGDRIGVNAGETVAQTRLMRTAPLWGIKVRNKLLHDGRTSDIASAVRAHDGQGAAARNAFNALSGANQHNVVQFVRSIASDTR